MKLICLGDSLTCGLGVPVEDNWVSILGRKSGWQTLNRGVNGDTSGGMLARLERDALSERPDAVFLMGGSNDFIMGCDPGTVKANIMAMVHQLRAVRIGVILGIEITGDIANVRSDWAALADFREVDRKLADMSVWLSDFCRVFQIPHVNLHDGFLQATCPAQEQYFIDGIHPNKKGHRILADLILESGVLTGNTKYYKKNRRN